MTPIADRQLRNLRGRRRDAAIQALGELRARGCEAGGYRLAGAVLNHLCCRHLYATDRMIIAWPATDHAVVIAVSPHDRSDNDVYATLLVAIDRDVPEDEREKPPCCDEEGLPPVDPDRASEVADSLQRLARARRRAR